MFGSVLFGSMFFVFLYLLCAFHNPLMVHLVKEQAWGLQILG